MDLTPCSLPVLLKVFGKDRVFEAQVRRFALRSRMP